MNTEKVPMSSDDDAIPPSPPSNSQKLNVVMFKKIRRRTIQETIELTSESEESIDFHSSNLDASKKTSEQNVRQSPKSDPPPQKKTVQQSAKLRKSLPGENIYPKRQSLNPDPSSKKKTLDKNVTFVKSIHEQKKNQKIKSQNSDTKKTPEQYARQSPKSDPPPQKKTVQQRAKLQKSLPGDNRYPKRQSLNPDPSSKKKTLDKNIRVPKSKTPEEKKNRKRQLPSESEEQSELYLQAKRKRIAEWVQNIATGGKVSKFPSEVEEKQKRQSQHSDSHSVHKRTEKAATTSMSTSKKKTGEDTIPLQKRYRPYVKCQECGTLQKNIWRHRRQMHNKEKDDHNESNVMGKGGYIIRICPYKDCGAVITRMKDHLVRTHKVERNTKKLDRLMKQAVPLTERKESPNTSIDFSNPDNKPNIIEISDDDSECMNVKSVKKERNEIESDEEQDFPSNDSNDDTNSVTSLMFQPTQLIRKEQEKDSNDDTDSVGSLGFETAHLSFMPTQVIRKEQEEDSHDDKDSVGSLGFEDVERDTYSTMAKERRDKHRKVEENRVLKGFIEDQVAPPNLKPLKVAIQHAHQVFDLWEYITPNLTIKDLFEISKLNEWTGIKLLKLTPGTIRSYLSSMGLFIEYLIEKGIVKDVPRGQRFRESLKITAKKLKKRAKLRRTVVETEEIETMILPADIQQYLMSDATRAIEHQIENPSLQVVPSHFFNIRDYLLLRLLQTNAQRPMAVRNITTKSIDRAKKTDVGGALIMVAKHKTAESGPAVLAVNPKLYGYLRRYLDMLRIIPGYNLDDERSIFTSWPKTDGTVTLMTSSHVNKAINRIWEQGPVVKSISATRLRKATSTAVRTAIPSSREVLARHMTHNPETADRHYALYNQRELAVPVTNMISAVMEGKSTVNIMKSIHWPKEKETDNITQDSTQKGDNITVSTKKCHGRRSFEGHEAEKLIEICDELILKEAITKSAVMEKVTGSDEGRIIFLQLQTRIGRYKDVWKVITDRLQTEKKRRRGQIVD